MKNFKDAVRRHLEREGWHVFVISDSAEPADLKCLSGNLKTLVRARGNGHGHITVKTEQELRALGAQCNAHVLLASVNGENTIVFRRVYP